MDVMLRDVFFLFVERALGCVHYINFFLPFFLFSTVKFPDFRGGKLRMVTPGHCIEEIS